MPACNFNSEIQSPDVILKWLTDETFFSICSRQHAVWGNLDPTITFRMLFDSIRHPIKHDFPNSLDALRGNIGSIWGDADSIIYGHTVFPLFIPFQSQSHIQTAIEMLKGSSTGSIKYRLGLITGRFGAEHILKACSCCIESDIRHYGVAYWHRAHQFPGVLICTRHKVWLQESFLNRRWSGRFRFVLPDQTTLTARPSQDLEPLTLEALDQFASSILALAAIGATKSFNPLFVKLVYRNALSHMGYRSPTSHEAASSLAQHASIIQPFHPLTSLPTNAQKASTYIEQLIRNPRGHSHPIRHLVMITWLFGELDKFVDAYDRIATIQEKSHSQGVYPLYTNKQLPKPSNTNQTTQLRPKTLKPAIRAKILRLLSRGTPKHSICSHFGISISTVNKLLRTEPLVNQSWAFAKSERDLLKNRKDWISLSQIYPSASASITRSHNPKLYAWLYRNDKDWLLQNCAKLPTGRNGNNSRIDWNNRDNELEKLIQIALDQLFSQGSKNDVGMHNIYALVPSLFRCLQNSNPYPRTRALLLSVKQQKLSNAKNNQGSGSTDDLH
jgi:hypothetical protein